MGTLINIRGKDVITIGPTDRSRREPNKLPWYLLPIARKQATVEAIWFSSYIDIAGIFLFSLLKWVFEHVLDFYKLMWLGQLCIVHIFCRNEYLCWESWTNTQLTGVSFHKSYQTERKAESVYNGICWTFVPGLCQCGASRKVILCLLGG